MTTPNKRNWKAFKWANTHDNPSGDSGRSAAVVKADWTRIIEQFEEATRKRNYELAAQYVACLDTQHLRSLCYKLNYPQLCQNVPYSLPVIEAIYSRMFLGYPDEFPSDVLSPQQTVLEIVKYFYCLDTSKPSAAPLAISRGYDLLAERILRVVAVVSPGTPQYLKDTQETIRRHLDGLGGHGLVNHESHFVHLHRALYTQLTSLIAQYKQALLMLEQLGLVDKDHVANDDPTSFKAGKPSSKHGGEFNHQKLLDVTVDEIQQRLYKNKAFLNVIEPTFKNSRLSDFYESLCDRVDLDKDVLVLFNQIRKDNSLPMSAPAKVGQKLLAYVGAIERALMLMQHTFPTRRFTPASKEKRTRFVNLNEPPTSSNHGATSTESGYSSGSTTTSSCTVTDGPPDTADNFVPPPPSSPMQLSHSDQALPRRLRRRHRSPKPSRPPISGMSPSHSQSQDPSSHTDTEPHNDSTGYSSDNDSNNHKNAKSVNKIASGQTVNLNGLAGGKNEPQAESSSQQQERSQSSLAEGEKGEKAVGAMVTPRSVTFNSNVDAVSESELSLRNEMNRLRGELDRANGTIRELQEREEQLLDRISQHVQKKVQLSGSFETLDDAHRPSQLIQRYSDLYCELRPDAMDALDDIIVTNFNMDELSSHNTSLDRADDLKQKILFSVVVLAFRSVQRSIEQLKRNIYLLIGTEEGKEQENDSPVSVDQPSPSSPSKQSEDSDFQRMLFQQLKKSAGARDTSGNFLEVSDQLWTTLYDYPSLKTCQPLLTYIKECVQLAWQLLLANPPYHINYHATLYDASFHNRFHTSDQDSTAVGGFIWPALVEDDTGHCVSKGIVIT